MSPLLMVMILPNISFGTLQLQEIASEAADFARSWIRRAKEAAQTGITFRKG